MTIASEVSTDATSLVIKWADGRICRYPYRYLRLQCGCAACVEEMTGRRVLVATSVPENIIIVEHIRVGRYALQFLWSDGHSTGIYSFDNLKKLAAHDNAVLCTGP